MEDILTSEQKVCRRKTHSINPEDLIDIIDLDQESWRSLDDGQKDNEAYTKLHNYYIDVAMYNRKLELLKQGYYDTFEQPDTSWFQDMLCLSRESQMALCLHILPSTI